MAKTFDEVMLEVGKLLNNTEHELKEFLFIDLVDNSRSCGCCSESLGLELSYRNVQKDNRTPYYTYLTPEIDELLETVIKVARNG